MNLYQYVISNPLRLIDHAGTFSSPYAYSKTVTDQLFVETALPNTKGVFTQLANGTCVKIGTMAFNFIAIDAALFEALPENHQNIKSWADGHRGLTDWNHALINTPNSANAGFGLVFTPNIAGTTTYTTMYWDQEIEDWFSNTADYSSKTNVSGNTLVAVDYPGGSTWPWTSNFGKTFILKLKGDTMTGSTETLATIVWSYKVNYTAGVGNALGLSTTLNIR